jgi:hypothetical protein
MRWPDWARPGEVQTLVLDQRHVAGRRSYHLPEQRATLCRRHQAPQERPLMRTPRSDVVASLTKIMRKFGGHDLPQHTVLEKIEAWLAIEMEKNKPRAHDRLRDRAECMKVFARRRNAR